MMANFRIASIADPSRQLEFSPYETRRAQVTSAEELLHLLDPAKAYPLDFIVFKITGYHPRHVSEDLLTGLALEHDLGVLIERVSDTLNAETGSLAEPVLTIDDVSERFSVTSKTIQRWRRRGLPGRKFIFPDGKRRVGFLLSSVERFFSVRRDQVDRGADFSIVGPNEQQEILRRARRLAEDSGLCESEITRRIRRCMDRSPLPVLHTVRKHDEGHPDQAIFSRASGEVDLLDRERILKGYRRGLTLAQLAHRVSRPRQVVYRVILEERVARLNRKKIRFIDDALYHGPDAAAAVDTIASQQELAAKASREENRIPRDLPPYLQDLYRTPLLSPSRERALFLKFNFHKFQFAQARRKLDPQFARHRDLQNLEGLLHTATDTKNAIVQANLRLVVSIARKHLRPGNEPSAATLEQVGQRLGLTKQRVRQIEQLALAKLRVAANPAQSPLAS